MCKYDQNSIPRDQLCTGRDDFVERYPILITGINIFLRSHYKFKVVWDFNQLFFLINLTLLKVMSMLLV